MPGKSQSYEIEAILGHKAVSGEMHYLVKWLGYPSSDNSWEPAKNLNCPKFLNEYKRKHGIEDKKRGRPSGSKGGGRYANHSKKVKKSDEKATPQAEHQSDTEEEEKEQQAAPSARRPGRPKKVHGNRGKKPWNSPSQSASPVRQIEEQEEDEEQSNSPTPPPGVDNFTCWLQ